MRTNDNINGKNVGCESPGISWKWGLLILVAAIGIPVLPLFFEPYDAFIGFIPQTQNSIDPTKAGQFGDFVGGFIGTIAFIASVFVLYVSYQNQKATNRQMLTDQRQMIESQDKANKRTIFEARFFELLKIHRENVAEFEIEDKKGGPVFVYLIREFRLTLNVAEEVRKSRDILYNQVQEIDLVYLAFYYGVGPNSTRLLHNATSHLEDSLAEHLIRELVFIQNTFRDKKMGLLEESEIPNKQFIDWAEERLGYQPFDGHQSRLGHYYRHLWQMMKYVDGHAPEGTAKEYAGIVRAQLSNHEQALLCLNALSSIGAAWNGANGLLNKYELIKNIPKGFFDSNTELDLKRQFPNITFEYEVVTGSHGEPNRETTTADE